MTDTASPIVTPEAVVLDFETAGVGSRCIAKLIDVLIQAAGYVLIALIVGIAVGFTGTGGDIATVLLIILGFLVLFGYPVASETLWNGKTVGKSVMGVRTVTREGAPIRFRHASVRGVIGLVEVYAFGFIAVITAALSRTDQRVGDMAGGTIVIRERTAVNHAVALTFYVPPGYESYVASLDVSAIDAQQYQLIRSYLTRVLQLSPDARLALALRLANPVAVALDHDPPAGVGPELFLACVAAAYQQRHGGAPAGWGVPAWPAPQPTWGPPTGGGYGWGPAGQPPYAPPSGAMDPYGQAPGAPYAPPPTGQVAYAPAPSTTSSDLSPPAAPPPPAGWAPPPPAAAAPPPPPTAAETAAVTGPAGFDPPA